MPLNLDSSQNGFLKLLSRVLKLFRPRDQRRLRLVPGGGVLNESKANDTSSSKADKPGVLSQSGANKTEPSHQRQVDFESEVQRFLQWCHANKGALYVWPNEANRYSGKGLKNALYQGVYDCSGYVTCGIFHATKGKLDLRATHSAQRLWDTCQPCEGQGPCLAMYGLSDRVVTHVVVVLPDGRVIGQSRGDSSCINPAIALDRDARVVYHQSAAYRKDLRGFRRLPLKEDVNA